jgi:hypothetical protein
MHPCQQAGTTRPKCSSAPLLQLLARGRATWRVAVRGPRTMRSGMAARAPRRPRRAAARRRRRRPLTWRSKPLSPPRTSGCSATAAAPGASCQTPRGPAWRPTRATCGPPPPLFPAPCPRTRPLQAPAGYAAARKCPFALFDRRLIQRNRIGSPSRILNTSWRCSTACSSCDGSLGATGKQSCCCAGCAGRCPAWLGGC